MELLKFIVYLSERMETKLHSVFENILGYILNYFNFIMRRKLKFHSKLSMLITYDKRVKVEFFLRIKIKIKTESICLILALIVL